MNKEDKKREGFFPTPTIWVNEAHKMIAEQFGDDWKENYVIWDCAWGSGNLTRDYKFKELYCSTLHNSDIQTATQMGINPEATKFQFDFLNDDLELLKEPDYAPGLYKALQEGKEIIFLINPPYGESKGGGVIGKIGSGVSNTNIANEMKKKDMGYATRQLYAQFLYKIKGIKNSNICLFSPPLFLTGSTYNKFRKDMLGNLEFKTGYIINANNFADVKDWGLTFSIFNRGNYNKCHFDYMAKKLDKNLNVLNIKMKSLYNLDEILSCSDWVRIKVKDDKLIDTIQLSSGLTPKQSNSNKIIEDSISYLRINTNKVGSNTSEVGMYSSATSNRGGVSLTDKNFIDGVSLFTARKCIKSNWINQKDEYIAPSEDVLQDPEYKQWNNDAIIYSLFNTSSNQSSMRQVEYKEKLWDIKNEFFFMSKQEMMELAEENLFDDVYKDARSSDERYVYNLLQSTTLSSDAQEVLDMAKDLIRKSFKMRKFVSDEHPEYHLNTWDAGWYQIKLILKEYYKEEYKVFTDKYKEFENRMRPYVYKFGFLK